MNVIKVWVPPREYLSVQALYDAANALYWKIGRVDLGSGLKKLRPSGNCEL